MGLMRRITATRVVDPSGATRPLGELAAGRPLVLVFVRHFRCVFCREELARIGTVAGQIDARGFSTIGVGVGPAADLREVVAAVGPAFPLVLDPRRELFGALGLRRSRLLDLLLPASLAGRLGPLGRSVERDTSLASSAVIALDVEGRERFRHVGKRTGDQPSLDALLAALGA
jgi:hypothetical protein